MCFMKLLFFVITLLFFGNINANAISCSSNADCTGANQTCLNGSCSIRQGCMNNNDCSNQRACIGARVNATCMDIPNHVLCEGCKADANSSDYFINTGGGVRVYYDPTCLTGTIIGTSIVGGCQLDGITESLCWFVKLLVNGLGKWLVLLVLLTVGFRIFVMNKMPTVQDGVVIGVGTGMIFGAAQFVSMITGVSAVVC